MEQIYNANLFELTKYRPLTTNIYSPEITPEPDERSYFYQILGILAKKLSFDLGTAVISEYGQINILEDKVDNGTKYDIILPQARKYVVQLNFVENKNITINDDPIGYGRLISKIVDLALVYFSTDYYKYSERSPFILERGEGYFDESLRNRIGIEDGRKYYRGLKIINGIPNLLIDREIELRSYNNLLNELKILGELWKNRNSVVDFDFYNPPEEFIKYINWIFRNRTSYVKAYESRSIKIKEITWDTRANDKIIDGKKSPIEYHKEIHGIKINDSKQPLVIWELETIEGEVKVLNHVPELLVVRHNFKDLSMRISKSRISQVFDILQPNCTDLQRKIYDLIIKIDAILRDKYNHIYTHKIEFSRIPKNITNYVMGPPDITILFKNKEVELRPPYGINFYRRYSEATKFIDQIKSEINCLIISNDEYTDFIKDLISQIQKRNECNINYNVVEKSELSEDIEKYDLIMSIKDDGEEIYNYKINIIGKYGIPHQNIRTENTNASSIPQLAMQVTLKLGGNPWLLKQDVYEKILSLYSYRNPFSGIRFFIYNIIQPNGKLIFQSKPYRYDDISELFKELKNKVENGDKYIVLLSYIERNKKDYIITKIKNILNEYIIMDIFRYDHLRIFSTYKPSIPVTRRRRRRRAAPGYPIEAYEAAPQGIILKAKDTEYYALTTGSIKIGTYYRGCPNTIKINILEMNGIFNINDIIISIIRLNLASATSGHSTRMPSPIYYLTKYAKFINDYVLPKKEKIFETLFYV